MDGRQHRVAFAPSRGNREIAGGRRYFGNPDLDAVRDAALVARLPTRLLQVGHDGNAPLSAGDGLGRAR
jgi:hypothetical protein